MSHEDIIKAVMSVINGTHTYRTAATRYHVPNSKILQVATTPEYIQEQWYTPLVESYDQQIFGWIRNHLNLP